MKHVLWLVAGTTEGRKLATALAAFPDMEIYVSVATAYGAALLPQLPQVKILQQRMDAGAMRKFLQEQKPELVLEYWDERLTTAAAQRMLVDADMSRSRRRKVVDKVAASLILQGYMDLRARRASSVPT